MSVKKDTPEIEEHPPIFKRWSTHYTVVLLFHALMIILFSWLTLSFQ